MTRRRIDPEQRAFEVTMGRFFELPTKFQLRAYAAMHDYLSSEDVEVELDRILEERRLAGEAIEKVAAKLELAEGTAPTQAQFNTTAKQAALGWDSNRVRRAWGSWRAATSAFLGGGTMPTAVREALKQATIRRRRDQEDYLLAIRKWLETKPAQETVAIYNRWRREWNNKVPAGELPAPTANAITAALGTSWDGAKQVARGEVTMAEAPKVRSVQRVGARNGPHDLIALAEVATILDGDDKHAVWRATHAFGFPPPALLTRGGTQRRLRLWRRSDVEAFAAGKPYPRRRENELADLYLDSAEVAKLVGLSLSAVLAGSPHLPRPVVSNGSCHFWLREEVEAKVRAWRKQKSKTKV